MGEEKIGHEWTRMNTNEEKPRSDRQSSEFGARNVFAFGLIRVHSWLSFLGVYIIRRLIVTSVGVVRARFSNLPRRTCARGAKEYLFEHDGSRCYSTPKEAGLRIESLPFDRVPHQSRLFLDYLRDPVSLLRFYPSAVRVHSELAARAPEVLAAYRTDRGKLGDALEAMNRAWGAGKETLANITRLRSEKSIAVVTGQQIGLFTGPLYTVYKALSAVKLARCLTGRGTEAVPVFWMATEDHDWDEVRAADLYRLRWSPRTRRPRKRKRTATASPSGW